MTALDGLLPGGLPHSAAGAYAPSDGWTRAVSPRTEAPLARRRRLERRHAARVVASDAVVVAGTAAAVSTLPQAQTAPIPVVVTAVLWMAALVLSGSYGVVADATDQARRVVIATLTALGTAAVLVTVLAPSAPPNPLLAAAPAGLLLILVERATWRRVLRLERARAAAPRALVIGRPDDVARLTSVLGADDRGYVVAGALPLEQLDADDDALESVAGAAARLDADAVVVARAEHDLVRRLAWRLEGTAAELLVDSGLQDIASTRLAMHRSSSDLPFVRVRIAAHDGAPHSAKRALDIAVAIPALLAIALVSPVIALAIRLDSRGPVLFSQERVGRDGRRFRMLKFRSMTVSAEDELAALENGNDASGPLFKLHRDPRVTRVGRVLRRYSLDELPQFWNVLVGEMSVVGPRPPLPREVRAYDAAAFRRLYVKPGITGPWQVGGRSDLSWQESVRIDLGYVENWSLRDDLSIMWRTVKVMFRPEGAY